MNALGTVIYMLSYPSFPSTEES